VLLWILSSLAAAEAVTLIALQQVMENFIRGNRHHPEYLQMPERNETEIFEDLLAGIDSSYAQLDATFAANGLDKIEDVYSDARIRTDRSTGAIYLEICSSKVLPFDIHSTGTAAWNHFVFGRQRVPSRFYDFKLFAKVTGSLALLLAGCLWGFFTYQRNLNFRQWT
jgi:hypothetical protein